MKTLILFRHGKSDWTDANLPDPERPLAKRGRKASRAMGRFLRRSLQVPDSAVTSPATRARASLDEVFDAGGWRCPVRVAEGLYGSSPQRVLEEIRAEPEATGKLMIVGHEPTWSELTTLLLGGGSFDVPTGCMMRVDFECESWKDVKAGGGKLIWIVPPKLFTDGDFDL